MYGAENLEEGSDLERTAFRKAEKKYKLYYDTPSKNKKKKPMAVDLSDVLDFKSILEGFEQKGVVPDGIKALSSGFGFGFDHHVFCLANRPGFYFIPGALSLDEQCQLIKESLTEFPQPPNRTNHNAMYGPIHNLFAAAKEGKVFTEENSLTTLNPISDSLVSNGRAHRWKFTEANTAALKGNGGNAVSASVLLRKLRWSTLGLQFDWSHRNYEVSLPYNKMPGDLCELAKRLATPAMPAGEDFKPEAAIVNYFGLGDTLGGHRDDMEKDWSKPIVSMSLGCKAIFLLGGKTRHDPPAAMFLRTGDVVLMAGEARECFHGVCRIFTDRENAEITALELQFSLEEDHCLLEYIRNSRININIRQVF